MQEYVYKPITTYIYIFMYIYIASSLFVMFSVVVVCIPTPEWLGGAGARDPHTMRKTTYMYIHVYICTGYHHAANLCVVICFECPSSR